jgi:hypothetical protein
MRRGAPVWFQGTTTVVRQIGRAAAAHPYKSTTHGGLQRVGCSRAQQVNKVFRSKLDKMTLKLSRARQQLCRRSGGGREVFEPKSHRELVWLSARVWRNICGDGAWPQNLSASEHEHIKPAGESMHLARLQKSKRTQITLCTKWKAIPLGIRHASLHLEKRKTGWNAKSPNSPSARRFLRSARRSVANWREGASACLLPPSLLCCRPYASPAGLQASTVDVTPILMFPFLLLLRRRWRRPTVRATAPHASCGPATSEIRRAAERTCRGERASQVRDSDGHRMPWNVRLEIRLELVTTALL